jgi:hypothetical protein
LHRVTNIETEEPFAGTSREPQLPKSSFNVPSITTNSEKEHACRKEETPRENGQSISRSNLTRLTQQKFNKRAVLY